MKGSEAKIMGFMEGADKRYVIPVYQRKYSWKIDNCRQLYGDLKKIIFFRKYCFFGRTKWKQDRISHNRWSTTTDDDYFAAFGNA